MFCSVSGGRPLKVPGFAMVRRAPFPRVRGVTVANALEPMVVFYDISMIFIDFPTLSYDFPMVSDGHMLVFGFELCVCFFIAIARLQSTNHTPWQLCHCYLETTVAG